MSEKNYLRDPRLTPCEINRGFYVERDLLPPDRRLVVLESRVETERKEAARGQFTAPDVVQIICGSMSKDKSHMRRRPAVGLIERRAQLPEADIFWMALRQTRAARDRCDGCESYESRACCTTHGLPSWFAWLLPLGRP